MYREIIFQFNLRGVFDVCWLLFLLHHTNLGCGNIKNNNKVIRLFYFYANSSDKLNWMGLFSDKNSDKKPKTVFSSCKKKHRTKRTQFLIVCKSLNNAHN